MSNKLRGKSLFLLMSIIPIFTSLIVSCKTSDYESSLVSSITSFRDFDFNESNKLLIDSLRQSQISYEDSCFLKIKSDISNQWDKYISISNDSKKTFNDVDVNEKIPYDSISSKIVNKVCMNQQSFGSYYPRVSDKHELERYYIPNFEALKQNGYKLYIYISDLRNSNDVDSGDIKFENIDHNSYIKLNSSDEKKYWELTDVKNTGCLYYRTTNYVDTYSNIGDAKYSENIKYDIVAKKDNTILKSDWDGFNITINNSKNQSFILSKIGDWMRFDYCFSENLMAYITTQALSIYLEIADNYINYLKTKDSNTILLNGLSNLISGEYDGINSGDLLYYMFVYKSYFNYFQINLYNGYSIQLDFDQNMPLNNEIVVSDSLHDVSYSNEKIYELDFKPMIVLSNQVYKFVKKVWNTLIKYQDLVNKKWEDIKND